MLKATKEIFRNILEPVIIERKNNKVRRINITKLIGISEKSGVKCILEETGQVVNENLIITASKLFAILKILTAYSVYG